MPDLSGVFIHVESRFGTLGIDKRPVWSTAENTELFGDVYGGLHWIAVRTVDIRNRERHSCRCTLIDPERPE